MVTVTAIICFALCFATGSPEECYTSSEEAAYTGNTLTVNCSQNPVTVTWETDFRASQLYLEYSCFNSTQMKYVTNAFADDTFGSPPPKGGTKEVPTVLGLECVFHGCARDRSFMEFRLRNATCRRHVESSVHSLTRTSEAEMHTIMATASVIDTPSSSFPLMTQNGNIEGAAGITEVATSAETRKIMATQSGTIKASGPMATASVQITSSGFPPLVAQNEGASLLVKTIPIIFIFTTISAIFSIVLCCLFYRRRLAASTERFYVTEQLESHKFDEDMDNAFVSSSNGIVSLHSSSMTSVFTILDTLIHTTKPHRLTQSEQPTLYKITLEQSLELSQEERSHKAKSPVHHPKSDGLSTSEVREHSLCSEDTVEENRAFWCDVDLCFSESESEGFDEDWQYFKAENLEACQTGDLSGSTVHANYCQFSSCFEGVNVQLQEEDSTRESAQGESSVPLSFNDISSDCEPRGTVEAGVVKGDCQSCEMTIDSAADDSGFNSTGGDLVITRASHDH